MELELFSYISKNSFLNFKRILKRETFDQGTFLYKVHEFVNTFTEHRTILVQVQHTPKIRK